MVIHKNLQQPEFVQGDTVIGNVLSHFVDQNTDHLKT